MSGIGVLFAPAPEGGRVYASSFWLLGSFVVAVTYGLVVGVPRHRPPRRRGTDPEEFAAAGWLAECALVFATGGLLLFFLPYALFVWP